MTPQARNPKTPKPQNDKFNSARSIIKKYENRNKGRLNNIIMKFLVKINFWIYLRKPVIIMSNWDSACYINSLMTHEAMISMSRIAIHSNIENSAPTIQKAWNWSESTILLKKVKTSKKKDMEYWNYWKYRFTLSDWTTVN